MKRIAQICCALALFLSGARTLLSQAGNPAAMFSEANARYQKSDFAGAERAYRELIAGGVDSGEVYYNLANACFKQKRLGEAIYFWKKAAQRLPGDTDVRENLELSKQLVVDRIEEPEDPLPVRWMAAAVHRFTLSQESRAALGLFILCNALFSVYLLTRKARLALWSLVACLTVALFFVLVCGSLAWKVYERTHRQQGVIVAQTVEVRSGPGKGYITVATVHEGIEVRVRGQSEDWFQISLPNGWSGWLPKDALQVLD
jgi:tetratricopeptide (TPR) repeat protein